jgi:hypothetical protein
MTMNKRERWKIQSRNNSSIYRPLPKVRKVSTDIVGKTPITTSTASYPLCLLFGCRPRRITAGQSSHRQPSCRVLLRDLQVDSSTVHTLFQLHPSSLVPRPHQHHHRCSSILTHSFLALELTSLLPHGILLSVHTTRDGLSIHSITCHISLGLYSSRKPTRQITFSVLYRALSFTPWNKGVRISKNDATPHKQRLETTLAASSPVLQHRISLPF